MGSKLHEFVLRDFTQDPAASRRIRNHILAVVDVIVAEVSLVRPVVGSREVLLREAVLAETGHYVRHLDW
jgi:hypothetical protein